MIARRVIANGVKYALAFGLLGYVLYANWAPASGRGLRDIWQAHVIDWQPIHGGALLAALLLFGAGLALTIVRWHLLMRTLDLPISLAATLRIGLVGFFFNAFLPGSVGGDLVKAAAVAREQRRRTAAITTVLMDRVVGLWSLISFVAVAGGLCWCAGLLDDATAARAAAIIVTAAVIVGVSLLAWLVMGLVSAPAADRLELRLRRIPRVGGPAGECFHVLTVYRRRPGCMVWAVGLSWLSNTAFAVAFACGGLAFWDGLADNPLPSIAQHFLIVPIGNIIAAIPLFPGGAGINEAGFGGLYGLFGSAPSNGVLAALVTRLLSWVYGILGYLTCQRLGATAALATAQPQLAGNRTDPEVLPL